MIIKKIFLALMPLYIGITNYILLSNPYTEHINYSLRMLPWIGALILFFYNNFENTRKNFLVTIGTYTLPLPSWKLLISIPIVLVLINDIYKCNNLFIQSIIYGVFASAFFEEIFTRSLFIKYKMGTFEFIFFNIISSCAFSLMHAGFIASPSHPMTYIFNHFGWSFMVGLIAYKTQRIETTMILHSISNLIRYTIPTVLFGIYLPQEIQVVFYTIELIILGLCSHKTTKETQNFIN